MSNKEEKTNVVSIDEARIDKMKKNGHYYSMVEQFEMLRLKFLYNDEMTKQEGIDFVTYLKYFSIYGHSESFKYSCKKMLEKYVEPSGL